MSLLESAGYKYILGARIRNESPKVKEWLLGISAELLMGLQLDYTMQLTRNNAEIRRKMRSVRPYSSQADPATASR